MRLPLGRCELEDRAVVLSVASDGRIKLVAADEPFERIGAGRLEETIAHERAGQSRCDHRFRYQIGGRVDDIGCGDIPVRRHSARCLEHEGSWQHRQATQNYALGFRKQLVAPIERGPQRLLAWQCWAPPICEQPKKIVEPRREVLHTERGCASRCELDREGYSVEASTDLGYRGGSATVCRELRLGRPRPCNEELYCPASESLARDFGHLVRHMKAWPPSDQLPLHP